MYIVFLCLYSYMILFDFKPQITVLEIVLMGWIGTLLCEEIREVRDTEIAVAATAEIGSQNSGK